MTVKCRAPCEYRTYGKYLRTRRGHKILNKNLRDEGTCTLSVSAGGATIDEFGRCLNFKHWDEDDE